MSRILNPFIDYSHAYFYKKLGDLVLKSTLGEDYLTKKDSEEAHITRSNIFQHTHQIFSTAIKNRNIEPRLYRVLYLAACLSALKYSENQPLVATDVSQFFNGKFAVDEICTAEKFISTLLGQKIPLPNSNLTAEPESALYARFLLDVQENMPLSTKMEHSLSSAKGKSTLVFDEMKHEVSEMASTCSTTLKDLKLSRQSFCFFKSSDVCPVMPTRDVPDFVKTLAPRPPASE